MAELPVDTPGVRLSRLDTDRFGIVTARADEVGADTVEGVLDYCREHGVRLLVARTRAEDVAAAAELTVAGAQLMDTLVYYRADLAATPIDAAVAEPIELLHEGDAVQVEAIARESFADYSGHYHADHRLDRAACREVYASWARSCCEKAVDGSFVLVAGAAGSRVAFACFRLNVPDEGELVLGAVTAATRGRGLYTQLTLAGMARFRAAGVRRFVASTHLTNWAAQSAWTKAGLHPYRAYHTFHLWFEPR